LLASADWAIAARSSSTSSRATIGGLTRTVATAGIVACRSCHRGEFGVGRASLRHRRQAGTSVGLAELRELAELFLRCDASTRVEWPLRADLARRRSVIQTERVRIAFGTDESTVLTAELIESLAERGHEVVVLAEGDPWPAVGRLVGEAVASGDVERGIVCCYTGTGVSMAANKVAGVRAALCVDAETARGARRWNDANVLALSLRLTSTTVADEIVEAFLTTDSDESERANIASL
jgi:ribose 5-phosphate isomerase B